MARKPTEKKVSLKGLVYALAGKEQPYDVYRFGRGKVRYERPNHNPFSPTQTDITPPETPANFVAEVISSTRVDLTWDPVVDDLIGLDHYTVYRDFVPIDTTTSPSYSDTSALADQEYLYQVTASDVLGNESDPTPVEDGYANTDTEAPTTPGSMQAVADSQTQITVSWTASTDNVGVYKYRLLRDGVQWAYLPSGTLQFVDTGLQADTEYVYTVRAEDAAGNSSAYTAALDGTVSTPPWYVDPNWLQGDPTVVINGPSVTLTDDTTSSAYSNMFDQAFSAGGKFAVQFVLGDSFSVADSSTMYLGFRRTGFAEGTVSSFYWCALELDLNGVSFFRYTITGSAGIDIDNMPAGIGPGSIITVCVDADNSKMYINIDGTWLTKATFGGSPAGGNGIDIVGGTNAVKPCVGSNTDGTASHTTEILYGPGSNIPAGYTFIQPGWV